MSRLFGWDLPPGCRITNIPGNTSEDEKQESIEFGFYENKEDKFKQKRFTPAEWKYLGSINRTKHLEDIIWKAIEYGIDVGIQEEKDCQQENKYEERQLKDYQNERIRNRFKYYRNKISELTEVIDSLNNLLEQSKE